MAAKVSQLITGGNRHGKEIKTNGATVEPGLLVTLDSSGSTASLASSTTNVFGWAFGLRYKPYRPTTRVFADGEPFVVVNGYGEALLSADFFASGTIPSSPYPKNLYAGANGVWTTTSGSVKVGRIIGTRTRSEPVAGVGANQTLAHVEFNIVP